MSRKSQEEGGGSKGGVVVGDVVSDEVEVRGGGG
jgi:hypothetical protein